MIQQTSLQAFESVKIDTWENPVLSALRRVEGGLTAKEIMRMLNVTDPNHVRPRLTGLRDKKQIIEAGIRDGQIVWCYVC